MTKQEKSLKLVELMGWEILLDADDLCPPFRRHPIHAYSSLTPYGNDSSSLAQFAAILLKFPINMNNMFKAGHNYAICTSDYEAINPTQSNILDEILRINGVKIDE